MEIADNKLLERVRTVLTKKKETIAVAESVSAGMLQLALSQAELASEFFQGGITVYNLGQKYKHLQVEPIQEELNDCVSQQVSIEMALNVCQLFNSQWGVSITGYATPVPESGNKLFAYYAIAHKNRIVGKGKINAGKDKPFLVQLFYTRKLLGILRSKLR